MCLETIFVRDGNDIIDSSVGCLKDTRINLRRCRAYKQRIET